MSLLDNMTDTDISSLQTKNAILRRTLESQGVTNTKLKKMLDISIDQSLFCADHLVQEEHQKRFRELEKKVGLSSDEIHPGKPEATSAPEVESLDG